MDDEEDDVFVTDPEPWRSPISVIKQEERGTQTPGRPPARTNGMLPCGISEEPRRLFYGSAGLLLLAPSARSERVGDAMFREEHRAVEPRRRPAHSVEARIGQKLQMIGDQFYQEHMLDGSNVVHCCKELGIERSCSARHFPRPAFVLARHFLQQSLM
uniref:Uncharacterized protein n=1 Tax=Astyanax mexicanus TaxID=7994 RepID=A0A8B9LV03_ASTMX